VTDEHFVVKHEADELKKKIRIDLKQCWKRSVHKFGSIPKLCIRAPYRMMQNMPIEVTLTNRMPFFSVVRKEGIELLLSSFFTYIGLQAGNPIFVYGGLAIASLYILRNYL